jgi:hypothetical protein
MLHCALQLTECVEQMKLCISQGGRAASGPLLQRYREILFDYRTEYKKAASTLQRHRYVRILVHSSN